jgi:hypothetical protein
MSNGGSPAAASDVTAANRVTTASRAAGTNRSPLRSSSCSSRREDPQRPLRGGGGRDVAHALVACLIPQSRGHDDLARSHVLRHAQDDPDPELALVDSQWLARAVLLEIDRRRIPDFGDGDARLQLHRQDEWNQGGIARRVRVDVKAFRQRDLHGHLYRRAGRHTDGGRNRHHLHAGRSGCFRARATPDGEHRKRRVDAREAEPR